MLNFVFPDGKKKVMTFSYDDGNIHDRRLCSIFNENGMKCTFNLNSGIHGEWVVPEDEYKSLYLDNGHEIACHGKTHPFLEQIPYSATLEDVLSDRKNLEKITGAPVRGMAYPFGTLSDTGAVMPEVKNILRSCGIVYSRTTHSTNRLNFFPQDFLEWHPTAHHRENIMELGKRFIENPWGVQMLYIWGHSFEFENAHNWNIIEDFCKTYAHNEKVWYATNGEIFDYITTCRSLITSADSSILKNPSASSVWLEHDGKILEVKGGTTLKI